MIVLHATKISNWKKYDKESFFSEDNLQICGFLHCAEISTFKEVSSRYVANSSEYIILVIDIDKINSLIKWEKGGDNGQLFPHIYGVLNKEAIIMVLPILFDKSNNWIVNKEIIT